MFDWRIQAKIRVFSKNENLSKGETKVIRLVFLKNFFLDQGN